MLCRVGKFMRSWQGTHTRFLGWETGGIPEQMAAATVDRWNRRLGIAVGQDGSFEAPKGKPYFGYDYASAHLKAGQII